MKMFVAVALIAATAGCQTQPGSDVKLENQQDKVSYSIGLNVGNSLRRDSIQISPEAFLRGVLDAAKDTSLHLLKESEIRQVMETLQTEMQAKQTMAQKAQADKNGAEGQAYQTENAKKQGVITMPSGLQYRVISEGKGKKPLATSTVRVHYAGRLIDGKEFDSSYKRGQPAEFPLNGVIRGWTEGLQLMTEGSRYEFVIPPALGYGEAGAGGAIPPNATLIFEVELLQVK